MMAFLPTPPLPFTRSHRARHHHLTMIRAPPTRPQTRVDTRAAPTVTPSPTVPAAAIASVVSAPPKAPVAPSAPISPHSRPGRPPKSIPSAKPPVSHPASKTDADLTDAPSHRNLQREFYYDDRLHRRQPITPGASEPEEADSEQEDEPRRGRRANSATSATSAASAASADDSIRSYLHEIGEVKLLDGDSEIRLAREIAKLLELERISARLKESTGVDPSINDWAAASNMDINAFRETLRRGLRAKEHMVAANLRLVVSIAKKYMNRGLTFQDLIQEGSIGLIRGAEKFDGNKGFKFSTYATWWIRQAITRAIADHSRPIRLPVHVNDTIAQIRKMTKRLHSELNRTPTEAEVAARMQLSIEKLRFLARSSRSTISLETPIGKDGRESNATLGSFIVWGGDTPEEATVKSLLREDLENVLNTLSPRERDVVRMRYGFDDGKMKTLEEIGSLFAVTRERIRQIEAKALRKLRHPNRNAVLREYVYEEQ